MVDLPRNHRRQWHFHSSVLRFTEGGPSIQQEQTLLAFCCWYNDTNSRKNSKNKMRWVRGKAGVVQKRIVGAKATLFFGTPPPNNGENTSHHSTWARRIWLGLNVVVPFPGTFSILFCFTFSALLMQYVKPSQTCQCKQDKFLGGNYLYTSIQRDFILDYELNWLYYNPILGIALVTYGTIWYRCWFLKSTMIWQEVKGGGEEWHKWTCCNGKNVCL